jgi:hypothetical protein
MSEEKKQEAARYNSGKPVLTFNLPLLAEFEARVSMFGAVKYESWNWTKGGALTTPMNSLERHYCGIQRGEWLDPDSGLPHAAHIRWNGGQMLQWYYTAERLADPTDTGVMKWDLPVFKYRDQLAADLKVAEERLIAAKAQYEEAKKKAGLA